MSCTSVLQVVLELLYWKLALFWLQLTEYSIVLVEPAIYLPDIMQVHISSTWVIYSIRERGLARCRPQADLVHNHDDTNGKSARHHTR